MVFMGTPPSSPAAPISWSSLERIRRVGPIRCCAQDRPSNIFKLGAGPPRVAHFSKMNRILSYIITPDSFRSEPKCSSPVKAIPQRHEFCLQINIKHRLWLFGALMIYNRCPDQSTNHSNSCELRSCLAPVVSFRQVIDNKPHSRYVLCRS